MKAQRSSGRCNMLISVTGLLVLALWFAPLVVRAEEPAAALLGTLEAEGVHSVRPTTAARVTVMDPTVFTDLSPVTVTEDAIRLPEDLRLDKGVATRVTEPNSFDEARVSQRSR